MGFATRRSSLGVPCAGACSVLTWSGTGRRWILECLTEAFRWARSAQLCLVAGTSALVHPAASLPLATLEAGGAIVEVNPTVTPLSELARVSLRGPAGEILPKLLEGRSFSGT